MTNTKRLLELSRQISLEEAWKQTTSILLDYSFDRVFYGYTDLSTAQSLGSPLDALIMTNLPDSYTKFYVEDGNYHNGPMTMWAATNTGTCSWSRIPELIANHSDPAAMLLNVQKTQQFGLSAGYTISFNPTGSRSKAAIGLCAKEGVTQDGVDKIWEKSGSDIELVCNILHLAVLALPHTFGRKVDLTPRQREIFELKADGKSVADISTLLKISVSTIEKHIAAAKVNLRVESVAQIVAIATNRNMFFQLGNGPHDLHTTAPSAPEE